MNPSLQYFKEYTSYNFDSYIGAQAYPSHSLPLQFKGKPMPCKVDLPTHLIDTDDDTERLYILKWTIKSNTNVCLDIFEFQHHNIQRFLFNMKPSLICLAGGLLYIVGGEEMQVIDFVNLKVLNKFGLVNEELFALEPAYIGDMKNGAILYSWNHKMGLSKKKFSRDEG